MKTKYTIQVGGNAVVAGTHEVEVKINRGGRTRYVAGFAFGCSKDYAMLSDVQAIRQLLSEHAAWLLCEPTRIGDAFDANKITALKANYDRKSRTYTVDARQVTSEDMMAAVNSGYLVFTTGDEVRVLEAVAACKLIGTWSEPKREAITAHLMNIVGQ